MSEFKETGVGSRAWYIKVIKANPGRSGFSFIRNENIDGYKLSFPILKEHIEKAEKIYPHAGDPAKTALITKAIEQKAPDAWAELEPILKAMSEQIEKGALFRELGKSTSQESDDTALTEINKMAKERIEKGLDTDFATAWTMVVKADPELYSRYLTETRRG